MSIVFNVNSLKAMPTSEVIEWIRNRPKGSSARMWNFRNEIRPSDLYCYLYAKFGPPNGLQNILRNDSSDNLIHWDWTLRGNEGLIVFNGMNQRTDIQFLGTWDLSMLDREQFIGAIKRDFPNYGKQMSEVRGQILEDWDVILNPFQNLKSSTDRMRKRLEELGIEPKKDEFNDGGTASEARMVAHKISTLNERYSEAFGLATSLRVLCPILAESFVNLLLFVLLKPEIKNNERLLDAAVRANIDIKVQSLKINCMGFNKSVDWSAEPCRNYNKIINERNDVLHGNIKVNKLKTGEVYFNGRVPVFKEYSSLWQKLFESNLKACGFDEIERTYLDVERFIEYVLSCLDPYVINAIMQMMNSRELGVKKDDGKIGVLFPNHIVEIRGPAIIE